MDDPYNWPVSIGANITEEERILLFDKLSIVEAEEPLLIIDKYADHNYVLAVRESGGHIDAARVFPTLEQLIGEWIDNEAHGKKPWVRHFNKETHDA